MNMTRITVVLLSKEGVHFENVVFGTDRSTGPANNRTYQRTGELYIQRERQIEKEGQDPIVVRDEVATFAQGQWLYVYATNDSSV